MVTAGRPVSARPADRVKPTAVNDSGPSRPVHTRRDVLEEQGLENRQISLGAAVPSDDTEWPARPSLVVERLLRPPARRNVTQAVLVARRLTAR